MTGRGHHESDDPAGSVGSQRIDKWLWYVRLVKSRTLASGLVAAGKVRINKVRVAKASAMVVAGDVVTVVANARLRVLRVLAAGTRRGPADEARTLYEDLSPPSRTVAHQNESAAGTQDATSGAPRAIDPPVGPRQAGAGRPTKRERRQLDRLRGGKADGG
ncbi:MAG: S4 domain-containing protein [Hyphomicrobiaceae bacterium]